MFARFSYFRSTLANWHLGCVFLIVQALVRRTGSWRGLSPMQRFLLAGGGSGRLYDRGFPFWRPGCPQYTPTRLGGGQIPPSRVVSAVAVTLPGQSQPGADPVPWNFADAFHRKCSNPRARSEASCTASKGAPQATAALGGDGAPRGAGLSRALLQCRATLAYCAALGHPLRPEILLPSLTLQSVARA
jgi:hypothetical protein